MNEKDITANVKKRIKKLLDREGGQTQREQNSGGNE